MPERDSSIDVDNLPNIQVEKRENHTPTAAVPVKPVKTAAKPPVFVYLLLLLTVLATGFLGWQSYQQQILIDNARDRVGELEARLSSTDESMSQSSVAMQVKLKELKDRSDELWTQMDKLWASAWRRNQKEITDHGKKLESYGKNIKELKQGYLANGKNLSSIRGDLAVLKAQVDEVSEFETRLQAQQKQLAALKTQLGSGDKALAELKKVTQTNSEWIDSINAYRKQTNQTISRLEQRIKQLHPAP